MTFKPTTWYPIALALTALNLIGLGDAARPLEPMHAAVHGALAFGFWMWARRLRQRLPAAVREARLEEQNDTRLEDNDARLEALDAEMSTLRQELSETQERLDFAERMLARGPDKSPR